MRGAYDDGVVVGQFRIIQVAVERIADVVHGRPDGIGLQPPQQFENAGIGSGANIAGRGIVGLGRPRFETPVLVIEEDAAILHRRGLGHEGRAVDAEAIGTARCDVGPPLPGRNAEVSAKIDDAINGPAAIGAGDQQIGFVPGRDGDAFIALPLALERAKVEARFARDLRHQRRVDRADHDAGMAAVVEIGRHLGILAGQALEVMGQNAGGQGRGFRILVDDRKQGPAVVQGDGRGVEGGCPKARGGDQPSPMFHAAPPILAIIFDRYREVDCLFVISAQ